MTDKHGLDKKVTARLLKDKYDSIVKDNELWEQVLRNGGVIYRRESVDALKKRHANG